MKALKLTLLISLVSIIFVFMLSSCYPAKMATSINTSTIDEVLQPTSKKNLYYDQDTNIVYIIFCEFNGGSGYGYMSPYYAPNGKPYVYDVETESFNEIQ